MLPLFRNLSGILLIVLAVTFAPASVFAQDADKILDASIKASGGASKLRKILTLECREVVCTDPYIRDASFVSVEVALAKADIVFLGACHAEYKTLRVRQPVVDVFDFLPKDTCEVRKAA